MQCTRRTIDIRILCRKSWKSSPARASEKFRRGWCHHRCVSTSSRLRLYSLRCNTHSWSKSTIPMAESYVSSSWTLQYSNADSQLTSNWKVKQFSCYFLLRRSYQTWDKRAYLVCLLLFCVSTYITNIWNIAEIVQVSNIHIELMVLKLRSSFLSKRHL